MTTREGQSSDFPETSSSGAESDKQTDEFTVPAVRSSDDSDSSFHESILLTSDDIGLHARLGNAGKSEKRAIKKI